MSATKRFVQRFKKWALRGIPRKEIGNRRLNSFFKIYYWLAEDVKLIFEARLKSIKLFFV